MELADETICRVCMNNSIDFVSIFEIAEKYAKTFAEILTELTRYKIKQDDNLPKCICSYCTIEAQNAFSFKEKFEQSNTKLLKLSKESELVFELNDHQDKFTQTEEIPVVRKECAFSATQAEGNKQKNADATNCPICHRVFSRKDHAKEHIVKIHKEDPKKYFESRRGCVPIDLKCHICARQFNRKHHVMRHIKSVHKQDEISTKFMLEQMASNTLEEDSVINKETLFSEKNPIGSDFEAEEYLTETAPKLNTGALVKNESHYETGDLEVQAQTFVKVETIDSEDYERETICYDEPTNQQSEDYKSESSNDSDAEPLIKLKKRRYESGNGTPEERTCKLCKRIFSRLCHLRRHIKSIHSEEKPHACPHCEKKFSRTDLLKNHIHGVHSEKTNKCDMCEKAFSRNKALQRHKQTVHSLTASVVFNCELCERSFSQKRFLQRHQLLHSDRIFACRYCEETFKDRKLFNEHERGHKSIQKDFLCSICGESFGRVDYLRIHVKRHLGDKQHKCQYCEKCFIRTSDLKEHERYHTNTKPNVCKICGKGFVRRYKLTIHMRTHTGEKPYICEHCPKSFAQRNDLKAHIRRHTGERFRCDQCDAAFLQLYGLRQHALNAHGTHIESSTGRLEKVVTECT